MRSLLENMELFSFFNEQSVLKYRPAKGYTVYKEHIGLGVPGVCQVCAKLSGPVGFPSRFLMIDPENFDQQLQVCLSHLYDYLFLQNYPFVQRLVPEDNNANRVQAFREKIMQALETMRPAPAVPFHARSARPYNVLNMRYVDQLDTDTISNHLALSKRQFWREHAKGLQILSSILRPDQVGPVSDDHLYPSDDARESEIDGLSQYEEEQGKINLHDLFASVLESIESLADQHKVQIETAHITDSLAFEGDWTLLRQGILALLTRVITQTAPGGKLRLSYTLQDYVLQIGITVELFGAKLAPIEQSESLTFLLRKLDADLLEASDAEFLMTVPLKHKTVLIIDDNADVVNLFRRYLADMPYHLLAADNGKQALALACDGTADVIILDIMLPKQDGFEVLQNLKANPQTRHIPVLVCSILDVQELAFSLGAEGYLHKPPGQAQLHQFLTKYLA